MYAVRYLGLVFCLLSAGSVVAAQPKSDDGLPLRFRNVRIKPLNK